MSAGTDIGRGHAERVGRFSFSRTPYWLIITFIFIAITFYLILSSEDYNQALFFIAEGIWFTVVITVLAYAMALVFGLVLAMGRISRNEIIYTIASLYVEIVRGVPLLVIIFYARFVIIPWADNTLGTEMLRNPILPGVLPLALGYSAYMAEIYRAGIESIDKGQMEAARSMGMSYFQAMRYVILPQAIKRVLPPMSNESLAMLKDSALLSAIGVAELTYWGKTTVANTANTFLGWNTVAFIYLILGLILSLIVKWVEKKATSGEH
jgi:polar amino acid transport system permease protein